MYLAHKREKENRQRRKLFYRHMGIEVQSGSEGHITEEEDWIYKFSTWEIDEDFADPSAPAPPPADDTVEESEAATSDEDDDYDAYEDE